MKLVEQVGASCQAQDQLTKWSEVGCRAYPNSYNDYN